MPLPKEISNSACRYGGAHLFFTTFTRTLMPPMLFTGLRPPAIAGEDADDIDGESAAAICSIRRMSRRTEE